MKRLIEKLLCSTVASKIRSLIMEDCDSYLHFFWVRKYLIIVLGNNMKHQTINLVVVQLRLKYAINNGGLLYLPNPQLRRRAAIPTYISFGSVSI
jgi:hypothetical protein